MASSLTSQVARAFLSRTLPYEEWTHEAHLRVGLWHLLRYSPADALERLRSGIREYNDSTGVANTDESGYHETTTRFYVSIICHFLEGEDRSLDVDELAKRLLAKWGDKRLPWRYYSDRTLMSVEARRKWVEPDLEPVPGSGKLDGVGRTESGEPGEVV